MADDATKVGPAYASNVNMNEDHVVRYWCKKFDCTREQLREAVEKVGTAATAVEAELNKKP